MTRAILAVLAAAGLACRAEAPRAEARGAAAPASAEMLLGATDEAGGQRAWLVRLEESGGALYQPPGALALRPAAGGPPGVLRSEPALGGGVYTLQGQAVPEGFKGTVAFEPDRRSPGAPATRHAVLLEPVRPRPGTPWGAGGVYTAAAVNDESGDLGGYELVVVPDSAGIRAVLTAFGEDGLPYLGRVEQAGGRWWLVLPGPGGGGRYELRPGGDTVMLVPPDTPEAGAAVLRRRGGLPAAFGAPAR